MSWTVEGLTSADLAASAGAIALDSSLRAAVLIGTAGVVCALLRRAPARWRHAAWTAALAGTAVMPLLALLQAGPGALARVGSPVHLALGVLWLLGFVALSGRLGIHTRSLRLQLDGSTPGPSLRGADVRIGGPLSSPVTFGWRPVVLLPHDFPSWPDAEKRQVLLHEAAHVARWDWAVQRLSAFVSHVFWFHPLVWVARRFQVLEAERAADEAVLRHGVRPSDYAQLLLSRSSERSPSPALAAKRWLEIRVTSLLRPPAGSPRWAPLGVIGILALPPLLSGLTVVSAPPSPHCEVSPSANEWFPASDMSPTDAAPWADAEFAQDAADPEPDTQPLLALAKGTIPPFDGDTARVPEVHDANTQHISRLSEAERQFLSGAGQTLVRNCPYNRAGAGIPSLMNTILTPHYALIDDPNLRWTSPGIDGRLQALQAALKSHMQLVDALGMDPLPRPIPGDYLEGRPVWTSHALPVAEANREALLREAKTHLEAVRDLVNDYDDDTKKVIDESAFVVGQNTEGRWPMKGEMIAYRTSLLEIEAMANVFIERGNQDLLADLTWLRDDCRSLIAVLDLFMMQFC